MMTRLLLLIVSVVGLGAAIGCQESTVLPPTTPTPLPSEKIGELTITCPVNVTVQSLNGTNARVTYPNPRVRGGQAPVERSCTPQSGSLLPIGRSPLRCNASDALGQTARCSFNATVLAPPRIAATRFLAFGDSITAGEVSTPLALGPGILVLSQSYPFKLQELLRQMYPVQSITVVNAGLSGEKATEGGAGRLSSQLSITQPDVVLIMEGTNDLEPTTSTNQVASTIDSMVGEAQARGFAPILATIAPVRPSTGSDKAARIPEYNDLIRGIAAGRGVPLVDVFAVISQGSCGANTTSLPCIGVDNIHPTAEGYELIAKAFFDVIVDIYDVPVSPTAVESLDESPEAQNPDAAVEGEAAP